MTTTPTGRCIWSCLTYEPPEDTTKAILKACESSLYLIYVHESLIYSNAKYCSIPHANLFAEKLISSLNSMNERLKAVPLCAATVDVSSGGSNWTPCQQQSFFPDPPNDEQRYVPYALWLLSIGAPLPDECFSTDMTKRFQFQGEAQPGGAAETIGKADDGNSVQRDAIIQNSILAQALAVEWLLEHNKAAVMNAIGPKEI